MSRSARKYLVLTAMIFAVAMMFVDQTIVAIAIPTIQRDLSLTATGSQWIINAYLLSLAALFAVGGKLTDVLGHRRMVIVGIVGFATTSALCGAAPTGTGAAVWLIVFRILQGAFGAIVFPAALAIVVNSFERRERGRALALFFGITGGLTSVGPIAGSFLLPWTWRAIFWINIPIAVIALILTLKANPDNDRRPSPIDVPGAVLVAAGMGLSVLGLQQAAQWGWTSVATWGCIVGGLLVLCVFVAYELRVPNPLIDLRIFAHRGFTADNLVLFLVCACFVPLFFFASVYAQVVLGDDAARTGLYLLLIFAGFASGSQVGGRMLDRRGARPPVVIGSALAAVGFWLWAGRLQEGLNDQWWCIVLAGAGLGLVLSPVSTDAVNRARRGSYGEVTGITQTVRNYGSSLGLAVLGSILNSETRTNIASSLVHQGIPRPQAAHVAAAFDTGASAATRAGAALGAKGDIVLATIQHEFAQSTRTVFLGMAGVMVVSFLAARFMDRGVAEDVTESVPAFAPD
jgi:EmrB/QacA subfamily drug resistance transporter